MKKPAQLHDEAGAECAISLCAEIEHRMRSVQPFTGGASLEKEMEILRVRAWSQRLPPPQLHYALLLFRRYAALLDDSTSPLQQERDQNFGAAGPSARIQWAMGIVQQCCQETPDMTVFVLAVRAASVACAVACFSCVLPLQLVMGHEAIDEEVFSSACAFSDLRPRFSVSTAPYRLLATAGLVVAVADALIMIYGCLPRASGSGNHYIPSCSAELLLPWVRQRIVSLVSSAAQYAAVDTEGTAAPAAQMDGSGVNVGVAVAFRKLECQLCVVLFDVALTLLALVVAGMGASGLGTPFPVTLAAFAEAPSEAAAASAADLVTVTSYYTLSTLLQTFSQAGGLLDASAPPCIADNSSTVATVTVVTLQAAVAMLFLAGFAQGFTLLKSLQTLLVMHREVSFLPSVRFEERSDDLSLDSTRSLDAEQLGGCALASTSPLTVSFTPRRHGRAGRFRSPMNGSSAGGGAYETVFSDCGSVDDTDDSGFQYPAAMPDDDGTDGADCGEYSYEYGDGDGGSGDEEVVTPLNQFLVNSGTVQPSAP